MNEGEDDVNDDLRDDDDIYHTLEVWGPSEPQLQKNERSDENVDDQEISRDNQNVSNDLLGEVSQ